MRILILEDERATAQLLGMLLTTAGHTVAHALDGGEGLQQLRAAPCDLVISDVQMVPMDGFGFLALARAEFPRLLVVLASACDDLHARVEKQPHKPFDVVHKPFRIEEIRRLLARATEALQVQAGIAQAAIVPGTPSAGDPGERMTSALVHSFPGTAFAPVRAQLARAMRQPGNALVIAEPGLISPEVLQLWRDASPQPQAPWQVVDATDTATDIRVALFGAAEEEAGPALVAARGGTLVLLNLDALPAADQARLSSLLRGTPPTRLILSLRRDPDLLLDEGLIDESLYFRFSTTGVPVPSLVDLIEHIDSLFMDAVRATPEFPFGSMDLQIEASASTALRGYRWPANLVELRAVAAWTASRMRSPRVTLAQLPERFQKIRLGTLTEALARAQREHLRRAVRITPSTVEAAQALGISPDSLTRALTPSGPALFSLGDPAEIGGSGVTSPSSASRSRDKGGFLVVSSDERLRLSLEAHFASMSQNTRLAVDGLQAIAQLVLAPVRPKAALIAGPTPPFELAELIEQLRRIEPSLAIATLGAEDEIEGVSSFPSLESMDNLPAIVAHLLGAEILGTASGALEQAPAHT